MTLTSESDKRISFFPCPFFVSPYQGTFNVSKNNQNFFFINTHVLETMYFSRQCDNTSAVMACFRGASRQGGSRLFLF